MTDQQSHCQTPGEAAVMGRGLGSRHGLHLENRICVSHLPDLTQKQAADWRLKKRDISSKIVFGYKKMLMDRGQELYCCADL